MHTTHPDLVAIKTAARHMATRLDNEATAAGHWASLARSRGVAEVVAPLEDAAGALREAEKHAEAVVKLLFDAQEREVEEGHHHQ